LSDRGLLSLADQREQSEESRGNQQSGPDGRDHHRATQLERVPLADEKRPGLELTQARLDRNPKIIRRTHLTSCAPEAFLDAGDLSMRGLASSTVVQMNFDGESSFRLELTVDKQREISLYGPAIHR
jgi:hypothetical protein